ncbi:C2H2-type zinc finger family protein [Actinidia rufa]|uniref:C2H2-type zinc finger family protein n=1 Tax=Actinidia rufa TaxID=165716 RepID=A0A7J0E0E6_9ERIC|nr:C2H2-type zinc finger family protein [Actinidia rufa]
MEALDIIKGKRTKRQRFQSPIPFSIPANSSSGDRYESNVTPTNLADFAESVITEEEEYMANCLILLSQARPYVCGEKGFNLTSKRFNVYQCKTCQRTFPSFQALGGHRASHKKPKPTTTSLLLNEEDESKPLVRGVLFISIGRGLILIRFTSARFVGPSLCQDRLWGVT